jgi:hypothetical protein
MQILPATLLKVHSNVIEVAAAASGRTAAMVIHQFLNLKGK